LEVRLREVSGSYGSYTVVINGSNSLVTNPVTFTVDTQAYKINIFNLVL
jgi:hypothetical protein